MGGGPHAPSPMTDGSKKPMSNRVKLSCTDDFGDYSPKNNKQHELPQSPIKAHYIQFSNPIPLYIY